MKKYLVITLLFFCNCIILQAQKNSPKLEKPEYSNEIYFFKKDSLKLNRLEKGNARMETKAKMGGMAGIENGYELEGEKSTVRLKSDKDISFIFYAGAPAKNGVSSMADSLMKSMGMDASMMSMANPMNAKPSSEITELYSMKCAKGKRKITIQSEEGDPQAANGVLSSAPTLMQAGSKGGLAVGVATVGIGVGMKLLGKAKKESVKYPLTIKKIKEDFYEILIDKNLSKGEYAFVLAGAGGIDNSSTLFAFAIE